MTRTSPHPRPHPRPRPRTALILLGTALLACSGDKTRTADATPAATAKQANGTAAPASGQGQDTISRLADRGRILGDSSAQVWVVMASDFQCPYCKQWHDAAFAGLVRDYVNTHKVRMAFLNMPLSIHQHAKPASEAAMCAAVQDKFWEMHDSLFATQKIWEVLESPLSMFDTLANHNHVEMMAWRACMSNHSTAALIDADLDRARQTGANSTPSFFVGSMKLAGADANVRGAIDSALKAAAAKPKR
jgi:protein-disulfide isomerase